MKRYSLPRRRQIRRNIVCIPPVICSRNSLLPNDFFEHEIRSASRSWYRSVCLKLTGLYGVVFRRSRHENKQCILLGCSSSTETAASDSTCFRENFIFQQDSAPAHRARETLKLLRRETPDFISPDFWPPNSPDLNSGDYAIWAVMHRRVYQTKIHTIDELKQRLIEVWCSLE